MPTMPWRIASQSYTVTNPDGEPVFTLDFSVVHDQADVQRLRIVPFMSEEAGRDADDPSLQAIEIEFATGGYPSGAAHFQPRWLKPFERPDPNLHIGDDKAADNYRNGLSEEARENYDQRRERYTRRREEWESPGTHDNKDVSGPEHPEVETDDDGNPIQPLGGPDNTDPNSPEAEQARAARSGVDVTQPSDADRKGMVGQTGGGLIGERQQSAQPAATNADAQKLQRQGKVVDSKNIRG